jgi:carbon-monoxide dehydrogenase large subunit
MVEPPRPLLAIGKVRHVGDPVALVIADTLEQAKDAAELIELSYNPLPAVVSTDEAIRPGKPQLFDNATHNICFDWQMGEKAAVDPAFTQAHHVTRLDIINNRLVSNPMEIRW